MTTTAQLIAAEKTARQAGDASLLARIDGLDARITKLENAAKPPVIVPGSSVVQVSPIDSATAILAAMGNMAYDLVEVRAGTYKPGPMTVNIDRTARPLTVRPVAGAVPTFGGSGSGGQLYFGLGGTAKHITMSGFIFDGYSIGDTGVIWCGNAQHMTLNNFTVRNVTVTGQGSIYSWALYLSHSGGVGPSDFVGDNWNVTGVNQNYSAMQLTPAANVSHVYLRGWNVNGVGYVIYASASPSTITDLQLSKWTIANSWRPDVPSWSVKFDPDCHGSFSYMTATNSGGIQQSLGGMTDGGNNSGLPVRP